MKRRFRGPRGLFFDPHDGVSGAMARLPAPLKSAVDAMNGKTLTLRNAMKRLRAVAESAGGSAEMSRQHRMILAYVGPHCWRLIRWKPVPTPVG